MNDLVWAVVCISLAALSFYLWTRRERPDPAAITENPVPHAESRERLDHLRQAQHRAEDILERTDEGVLLLDRELSPIMANRAARDLLGFQEAWLPARLPNEEVKDAALRARRGENVEEVLDVWFPLPMSLNVRAIQLEEDRGVLVLLRDVTQEVRAQRVRREFVSHASHELKSPVAGIQALAEAVTDAVQDDTETATRFAQKLSEEADRLGRLVRDLLDLSRLEDPADSPSDPADLSSVAESVMKVQRLVASNKGIQFKSHVAPEIHLRGDEQQLELLIRNLLDNALRYTPTGGRVELEVYREGTDVYVRVSDNGPGIPLEAQARVFERFYRVDSSRTRDKGGTGLGLAIVKHVAETHGGEVELKSAVGEGSVFTVRLPGVAEDGLSDVPVDSMAG